MDHQEAPVDGLPTTHWETQTEFLSPDFAPHHSGTIVDIWGVNQCIGVFYLPLWLSCKPVLFKKKVHKNLYDEKIMNKIQKT